MNRLVIKLILTIGLFCSLGAIAEGQNLPSPPDLVRQSAQQMIEMGDVKSAIRELESGKEKHEKDFELCQFLVDVYSDHIEQVSMFKKKGLAKTMLGTMEDCYALRPQDETAQLNLIMFHMNAPSMVGGDKEVAYKLVEDITAMNPERGQIMKARLALSEEKFEVASSIMNEMLLVTPNNTEALKVAGLTALHQNQYERAMAMFKRCVSVEPQNFDCQYQIGRTAHESGKNTDDGIAAFQVFIQNGNDDSEYLAYAHYRLAELLISAGETSKVQAHLETAIDLVDLKPAKKRLAKLKK